MTSFHILLIIAAAVAAVLTAAALIVDGLRIARETRAERALDRDIETPGENPVPSARLQFGLMRRPAAVAVEAPAETAKPAPIAPVQDGPAEGLQTPATRPQALAKAIVSPTLDAEPEDLHSPLEPFPSAEPQERDDG